MLEEKVRKNLYKLIEQYYRILKKQYKRMNNDFKIEQIPSELKQNLLNYQTSIFKNIEIKKIPFTQVFDLDKKRIYALNTFETEILRNYIGIYDNGIKQSVQEVSKRFDITTSKTTKTLKRIMDIFESQTGQKLIIAERNEEIKEKIQNKEYKKQILNLDITFLNITDNFIDILKKERINTVNDLLKITKNQIESINKQYGYYYSLKIIPKRLIEEIHSLGLKFKNEFMIAIMFENFEGVELNSRETIGKVFPTVTDAICARQFEPELLLRLNLEDNLKIDRKLNRGYMQGKYVEMSEDIYEHQYEKQKTKKYEIDYKHGKIYESNNN